MKASTTFAAFCVAAGAVFFQPGVATSTPTTSHIQSTSTIQQTRTDTISVPDMQCGSCERRISKKLKTLKGITDLTVNAEQKRVVVTYHPDQVQRTQIEQAIADVGYDAGAAKAAEKTKNALPMCCRPQ